MVEMQPPWALPRRLQCSGRMVQENVALPAGMAVAERSLSCDSRIEEPQPWIGLLARNSQLLGYTSKLYTRSEYI